jgi:hypothetical protein
MCLAYISGVADTLTEIGSISQRAPEPARGAWATVGICPGKASYGAAIQVFINWAAKHPEAWTNTANDGVYEALKETWPCTP